MALVLAAVAMTGTIMGTQYVNAWHHGHHGHHGVHALAKPSGGAPKPSGGAPKPSGGGGGGGGGGY